MSESSESLGWNEEVEWLDEVYEEDPVIAETPEVVIHEPAPTLPEPVATPRVTAADVVQIFPPGSQVSTSRGNGTIVDRRGSQYTVDLDGHRRQTVSAADVRPRR